MPMSKKIMLADFLNTSKETAKQTAKKEKPPRKQQEGTAKRSHKKRSGGKDKLRKQYEELKKQQEELMKLQEELMAQQEELKQQQDEFRKEKEAEKKSAIEKDQHTIAGDAAFTHRVITLGNWVARIPGKDASRRAFYELAGIAFSANWTPSVDPDTLLAYSIHLYVEEKVRKAEQEFKVWQERQSHKAFMARFFYLQARYTNWVDMDQFVCSAFNA